MQRNGMRHSIRNGLWRLTGTGALVYQFAWEWYGYKRSLIFYCFSVFGINTYFAFEKSYNTKHYFFLMFTFMNQFIYLWIYFLVDTRNHYLSFTGLSLKIFIYVYPFACKYLGIKKFNYNKNIATHNLIWHNKCFEL